MFASLNVEGLAAIVVDTSVVSHALNSKNSNRECDIHKKFVEEDITNAADTTVNNKIPLQVAKNWQTNGLKQLDKYEFDAKYKLLHDIIDPGQKLQNVAVSYPILLDLLARD